ncbi:MAG TPA: FMN-binding protein [Clostridia bacterium]
MKNTIKSVAVLTVIAVVCAALLTVANYFWKVEEPQGVTAELLAIFREMVEDQTAEFYELEINGLGLRDNVDNVYKASAGQNKDIVILKTTGIAGSYGTVQMLTAVDSSSNKIISTKIYYNDTDREQALKNLDAFKGLDNQTLQNTQFDVITNATITGNAMTEAVKLAMSEYTSKKQEILNAPAKTYELLSVNITTDKDIEKLEAGDSLNITIEIISSNPKKANPQKAAIDIALKRNGSKMTIKPQISFTNEKAVYEISISNVRIGSYELTVEAKIKDITAKGDLSFEVKDKIEIEVIKRMFEGVTEVQLVKADEQTGAALYKTDLDNYVYAYIGYAYEYGAVDIFIAFDEEGKVEKIDGRATNSFNQDMSEYFNKFVGQDASALAKYKSQKDLPFDAVSGVTVTSEAINETVAKICKFYLSQGLGE